MYSATSLTTHTNHHFKRIILPLLLLIVLLANLFYSSASFAIDIKQAAPVIAKHCPGVSKAAIKHSLKAFKKARTLGYGKKNILTIIDFSKASDNDRFCTINLNSKNVLFNTLVSHGSRSGKRFSKIFSNRLGSHKSSLGLFVTGKPYVGKAGYSLHLYGLDKGINDHANARHVVLHGSRHVSNRIAKRRHRIGHTLGCFGVSKKVAHKLINSVKDGSLIFAYYPTAQLLNHSIFLKT